MTNVETKKLDDWEKIPTQLLAVCNTTGNRVLCNYWQQTSFLEDEAIWWQCPDCNDWHLIFIKKCSSQDDVEHNVAVIPARF